MCNDEFDSTAPFGTSAHCLLVCALSFLSQVIPGLLSNGPDGGRSQCAVRVAAGELLTEQEDSLGEDVFTTLDPSLWCGAINLGVSERQKL